MSACPDRERMLSELTDGELPVDSRRELARHLAECPGCREELDKLCDLTAAALDVLRSLKISPERLRRRMRPRSRKRLAAWMPSGLAAAAAVVIAAVGYAVYTSPRPARQVSVARVTTTEGTVERAGPGSTRWALVRGGAALFSGQRLRVGDDGGAVVDLTDGSKVCLAAGTEASFEERGLRLARGEVFCRVAPQGAGRFRVETDLATVEGGELEAILPAAPGLPLVLLTPDARAEAAGGEFSLTMLPEGTRIEVGEGAVRFTRTATGESIMVHAGNFSEVGEGFMLAQAPLAPPAPGAPEELTVAERTPGRAAPRPAESGVEAEARPEEVVEEAAPEREPERVAEAPDESPRGPEPVEEAVEEPAEAQPSIAETGRHVGKLALTTGEIYYKREGGPKWFKAPEGIYLNGGDSLDTRGGLASVIFADGTKVHCNKRTWAAFGRSSVEIRKRGEVYCEVAAASKGKFTVVTEHATVRDLGTRFGVKASAGGTRVVVAEGKVECFNAAGSVVVEADHGTRVALARTAPGKPRKVDAAAALGWALEGALSPAARWRAVLAENFETSVPGQAPRGWESRDLRGKGTPNQWRVVSEGGNRFLRWGGRDEGYILLAGGREFTDVELSFRFRAPDGGLGAALRGDCWNSGYEVFLRPQGVQLVRSNAGGGDTALTPATPPMFDPSMWNRAVVRVVGDAVAVEVNGETVIKDVKDRTYSKGPVSLCGVRRQVDFDDVVVRVLPRE